MASVEVPSCPGEFHDAENLTAFPERRQNLEIPRSLNTTNRSLVVKIDSVLDRSSFKGSKPSISIASITSSEPPGDSNTPATGYSGGPSIDLGLSLTENDSRSISRHRFSKPRGEEPTTARSIESQERRARLKSVLKGDAGHTDIAPAPQKSRRTDDVPVIRSSIIDHLPRRSDNRRYSFVSDALANNIRRSREWLNLRQTNAHGPPHSLEDRLKAAMEKSNVPHQKFLPRDELVTTITQTAVENELSQFKHLPRRYIRAWKRLASVPIEKQQIVRRGKGHVRAKSDSVLSKQLQPPKEPEEKLYRKVFAILLFIRRPSRIWSFVEEGVCDADLPLVKVPRPDGLEGRFDLRRGSSHDTPLRCLRKWGDTYDFEGSQWIVLAPFFHNSNGKDVPHVELQPDHPLPFTSWKSMSRGGHGQVYKATVHHSHHAFDMIKVPSNIVAVKMLFSRGEKAFAKESQILKNLSSENHRHDHLITLLATYKQSGIYYLVFPWAKADLEGFWRLHPDPPTDNTNMAKWLVDQCQGLAEALSKIHRYDTRSDTTMSYQPCQATPQQVTSRRLHSAPGVLHLFGRHGDIKSNNILWFPDQTPHRRYGVLKITDFGIADFRVDDTGPTLEPPNSRTYRSPECDLEPRRLSTLCDIWALGCVYLVFITWYFGGLEEVESFTKRRRADGHSRNRIDNDHFFDTETDEGGFVKAKVKNTVIQKIDELRLRADNAELFRDLLDLVQQKMLVIPEEQTSTEERDKPRELQPPDSLSVLKQGLGRRKSSRNIAQDLGDIRTECRENPNYIARAMSVPEVTSHPYGLTFAR